MRLFTGIDLPPEVAARLDRAVSRLRPAARIKWSPVENLHITTKFIGEWPEDRLGELRTALESVPARAPIEIHIHDSGFFPNPRAPRVFWTGVEAPGLADLAQDTDRALTALGMEPEKRVFSPHLTLARIREPVPLEPLRAALASFGPLDFGRFTAKVFHLYLSRTSPSGSVYTKLAEFPFSRP